MGSVQRYKNTGGSVLFRIQYVKPDGSRATQRGFLTKSQAALRLAEVETSKSMGAYFDPTRARGLVSEWAESWFAGQIHLKPTTHSGYALIISKHIVPRWGGVKLSHIGNADVQAWVNLLAQSQAPSSVRRIHLVFKRMLDAAVSDSRLMKNPASGVNLPRLVPRRHGYLTTEQVRMVAELSSQHEDLILLLSYCGLRWGEAAALKVGSLDLLRRRLIVREAITSPRGQVIWGTPKSNQQRTLVLPLFLVERLARRCEGKTSLDLLFPSEAGSPLRGGDFRKRVFYRALREARRLDSSIPEMTLHDLRHTAASIAVSSGAHVKAVQRMLGHASAAMTLDVYADLFDSDLDTVAESINAAFVASSSVKLSSNGSASA